MARPGLRQHPKFRRLVHTLAEPVPHVLGYLECMWSVGYECGDSMLGDETDVELAAEYPGPKGKLFAALLDCRLIDQVDGKYHIHNLYINAPEYVRKRMDREAARRAAGQTLSEVRAAAARRRWEEAKQADASVEQTAATVSTGADGCMQADASVEQTALLPAQPSPLEGSIPQTPSCSPEGERGVVEDPPKRAKRPRKEPVEGFEEFWAAYPRKVKKQKAAKAWEKFRPDGALRKAIMQALEQHKRSRQWIKDDGEFIPYPATWLNGRQWEDELQEAGAVRPGGKTEGQLKQQTASNRFKVEAEKASAVSGEELSFLLKPGNKSLGVINGRA